MSLKLKQLARDILFDNVYTSQHTWYYCDENEDKWIETLFKVFNADALVMAIETISKENHKSFEKILFYSYKHFNLNPNQNELPIFKEVDFLIGDEYDLLFKELKNQVNQIN